MVVGTSGGDDARVDQFQTTLEENVVGHVGPPPPCHGMVLSRMQAGFPEFLQKGFPGSAIHVPREDRTSVHRAEAFGDDPPLLRMIVARPPDHEKRLQVGVENRQHAAGAEGLRLDHQSRGGLAQTARKLEFQRSGRQMMGLESGQGMPGENREPQSEGNFGFIDGRVGEHRVVIRKKFAQPPEVRRRIDLNAAVVALFDFLKAEDIGFERLQERRRALQVDPPSIGIDIAPRLAVLHVECRDAEHHEGGAEGLEQRFSACAGHQHFLCGCTRLFRRL